MIRTQTAITNALWRHRLASLLKVKIMHRSSNRRMHSACYLVKLHVQNFGYERVKWNTVNRTLHWVRSVAAKYLECHFEIWKTACRCTWRFGLRPRISGSLRITIHSFKIRASNSDEHQRIVNKQSQIKSFNTTGNVRITYH